MIKALFFDIDGTLVSFQTHEIPESTIRAIRAAHAKGIQIFISTGRPTAIINNLGGLQQAGLIDGYITMNGAYCYVGDEVIYKRPINPEDVKIIMDFCAQEKASCIVVGERSFCACGLNEQIKTIFQDHLKVTHPIPDTPIKEAIEGKEIFMLTPFIDKAQEAVVAKQVKACEIGRWHPAFADITAIGNTKQKGMDEIINRFGLKLEETMSFGDGGNDVPMLRHAGIGVAMGNAADDVKQHADYVTSSVDEDGIMNALLHFGIITPEDL